MRAAPLSAVDFGVHLRFFGEPLYLFPMRASLYELEREREPLMLGWREWIHHTQFVSGVGRVIGLGI